MASLASKIAEIEAILQSGVKVDEIDNQRVEYDHDSLRKELAKLKAQANSAKRPRAAGINLGGF